MLIFSKRERRGREGENKKKTEKKIDKVWSQELSIYQLYLVSP